MYLTCHLPPQDPEERYSQGPKTCVACVIYAKFLVRLQHWELRLQGWTSTKKNATSTFCINLLRNTSNKDLRSPATSMRPARYASSDRMFMMHGSKIAWNWSLVGSSSGRLGASGAVHIYAWAIPMWCFARLRAANLSRYTDIASLATKMLTQNVLKRI